MSLSNSVAIRISFERDGRSLWSERPISPSIFTPPRGSLYNRKASAFTLMGAFPPPSPPSAMILLPPLLCRAPAPPSTGHPYIKDSAAAAAAPGGAGHRGKRNPHKRKAPARKGRGFPFYEGGPPSILHSRRRSLRHGGGDHGDVLPADLGFFVEHH